MTTYFEHNEGRKAVGDVLEFKRPDKREIEHVDSSTIVEKLEMTDEMKAEFEELGYTFGDKE